MDNKLRGRFLTVSQSAGSRDGRSADDPEHEHAVTFCDGARRDRVRPLPVFRGGLFLYGDLLTRRYRDHEARCGQAIDSADNSP